MKISRRTGGGRGVYEIAGKSADGLSAAALADRQLIFHLTPRLFLRSGIVLKIQGGKPRLVIDNAGIQVQRQIATILLMPKPIRADNAMGEGSPILQTDAYVLEELEIESVELSEGEHFIISPGQLGIKNSSGTDVLYMPRRFSRVVALWANRDKFPAPIPKLLQRHQSAVRSGEPVGEDAEKIVGELQTVMAQNGFTQPGIPFLESSDPLAALDYVPFWLTISLCSKPFAILTGPSGTGKSKIAIELASAFDYGAALPSSLEKSRSRPATCLAYVPVGADWTDQKNLVGYANPFGTKRQVNGSETYLTYEITEALKLMLRAMHPNYRNVPHFLILDEMNLSHVERYFSSFLSLIEADRSAGGSGSFELITRKDLQLICEVLQVQGESPMEIEAAEALLNQQRGLPFPANLFVIGTVNIDETTYMFSPKVLDRAFVMEMKSVDPSIYLEEQEVESGSKMFETKTITGNEAAELFERSIQRRLNGNWERQKPVDILKKVVTGIEPETLNAVITGVKLTLSGSYQLLEPVGFGFGYRVVNEIFHYLAVWLEAQHLQSKGSEGFASEWNFALDEVVMMKILPKIHGNRRQLGDSLKALANFFSQGVASYDIGSESVKIEDNNKLNFTLPKSQKKAEQMNRLLHGSGYTTFIS